MTGKVFAESANIYEDQARVLFEYYKQAAQKIVDEEIDYEKKIEKAKSDAALFTFSRNSAHKKMIVCFVLSAVFFVLTGVKLLKSNSSADKGTFGQASPSVLEQEATDEEEGLANDSDEQDNQVVPNSSSKITANKQDDDFATRVADNFSPIILVFAIAFFTLLGMAFSAKKKRNKLDLAINTTNTNIADFSKAKSEIKRDYKVSKMTTVYVPVASVVPFEGKSFIVDHMGKTPSVDFELSVLRQPKDFQKTLADLEKSVSSVPLVEGNTESESIDVSNYSKSIQAVTLHDYMGALDRQVRNITYLLGDSDKISVSLPIVIPKSPQDEFLQEYTTSTPGGLPVIKVFDDSPFAPKLASFAELNEMKKSLTKNDGQGDHIAYLKKLMRALGSTVDTVTKSKVGAMSRLLSYTNSIFLAILKVGGTQYSPALEAEEIARIREATFDFSDSVDSYTPFKLKPSSRVKFDLASFAWVAEDGSRTNMPFSINQIQEEVLMPVINNLMEETRVERLRLYNNIKDQKMKYLNEWHKDVEDAFRDNRKTGIDLITQLTKVYSEYNTAYQTYLSYKATQDALKSSGNLNDSEVKEQDDAAEIIMGYQAQAQQCNAISADLQDYMDRLQDDITQKSEQFEHVEYYDASLRDSVSRETAISMDMSVLQNLDERKKRLVAISPQAASFAKVPSPVSIESNLDSDFTINLSQKVDDLLRADESGTSAGNSATQGGNPSAQTSDPSMQSGNSAEQSGDSSAQSGDSAGYDDNSAGQSGDSAEYDDDSAEQEGDSSEQGGN